MFREGSSGLEGFEQLLGAAGWMPLQTMSPGRMWEGSLALCYSGEEMRQFSSQ